jgi:tetraacyldisaccharide 4'-kinase
MRALLPLSWIYAAGVALDRRARARAKLHTGTPHIVSIGNLEAGGNGKTPLALWWLARDAAAGRRVAYVSRGYGGAGVSARVVTCLPPPDALPARPAGLRLLSRTHADLAREIGDEGALVAGRAPDALVLFCRDKRRAIGVAADLGADTVVLDDAFQSWNVGRHLDVVLLDAEQPLDGGVALPAGRLRESPAALRRADVVVFNGASSAEAVREARGRIARWLREGVPAAGLARRVCVVSPEGEGDPAPRRLVAVSGIARPEAFARSLAGAGVDVAAHLVFRDHHRYDERDAARIAERARSEGADLVTTEKDWVKLRGLEMPARVWVARLEVSLVGDSLPGPK